jgi:DNA polymerase I
MKKLFLLDGHALIYRAHYAFITRPLINSKGLNTSAISGFTRTLWDIISNEKPSHLAVAFDLSGPTFRHIEFPDYKANREAQPEDITKAFPYIEELIKAFNIPIITMESFEADDVIGTIAKQAAKEGFTVYMVTPDKDYGQLVEDQILMYKPSRQGNGVDILGPKEITEGWGIQRVDQVIDLLGLMGDAVDNIPGIPGVGEKTAVKLLAEFDTLENLIQQKDSLQGKLKEKVSQYVDQAILSKKLATININAPIRFDEKMYRVE